MWRQSSWQNMNSDNTIEKPIQNFSHDLGSCVHSSLEQLGEMIVGFLCRHQMCCFWMSRQIIWMQKLWLGWSGILQSSRELSLLLLMTATSLIMLVTWTWKTDECAKFNRDSSCLSNFFCLQTWVSWRLQSFNDLGNCTTFCKFGRWFWVHWELHKVNGHQEPNILHLLVLFLSLGRELWVSADPCCTASVCISIVWLQVSVLRFAVTFCECWFWVSDLDR